MLDMPDFSYEQTDAPFLQWITIIIWDIYNGDEPDGKEWNDQSLRGKIQRVQRADGEMFKKGMEWAMKHTTENITDDESFLEYTFQSMRPLVKGGRFGFVEFEVPDEPLEKGYGNVLHALHCFIHRDDDEDEEEEEEKETVFAIEMFSDLSSDEQYQRVSQHVERPRDIFLCREMVDAIIYICEKIEKDYEDVGLDTAIHEEIDSYCISYQDSVELLTAYGWNSALELYDDTMSGGVRTAQALAFIVLSEYITEEVVMKILDKESSEQ